VFVLHNRPLRAGVTLEQSSRFGEDIWLLGPAFLQQQGRSLTADFTAIPAHYRVVSKELLYAMLSGPPPPGQPRPSIATTHSYLRGLKKFLNWLDTRPPTRGRASPPALLDLTTVDLQDYQRYLMATLPAWGSRAKARGSVRMLWRYRELLTDRLAFDPQHVPGWGEPQRRGVISENATDRIPEQVHGPLMAWALRFVDDFAPDILASARRWHEVNATVPSTTASNLDIGERLHQLLAGYRERGQPLPGHQSIPNTLVLANLIGCSRDALTRYDAEIKTAASELGLNPYSVLDVPIAGQLDGRPWIDGTTNEPGLKTSLRVLATMLQASAYALIAFLSGMRDPEIKHLRRGCLQVQRDSDGQPYRYKITSLAFKGETDPNGTPATWVIGAPAARAIQVLERLQPPGTDLLFAHLTHSLRGPSIERATRAGALSSRASNRQLNALVDWIDTYCAVRSRHDSIPLVNNQRWSLTTRQFRRTLAWFIARRPGGAIAGAIAFRHLSVQMFEGYAGTSDSGFRPEVESEQALARGEHLLAMIDTHEHLTLAGPAASEATRRLKEFDSQARFAGAIITDDRRLRRLMQREDPAIYPGKYITCVHNHAAALCQQRRDSRDRQLPELGNCRPFVCRNVALTPDNVDALGEETTRIDHELATRPLLPPLLHHQLANRREEIATFLARHGSDSL
jgi:hypothetical protein